MITALAQLIAINVHYSIVKDLFRVQLLRVAKTPKIQHSTLVNISTVFECSTSGG